MAREHGAAMLCRLPPPLVFDQPNLTGAAQENGRSEECNATCVLMSPSSTERNGVDFTDASKMSPACQLVTAIVVVASMSAKGNIQTTAATLDRGEADGPQGESI